MKKLFAIVLVICLLFAGYMTWTQLRSRAPVGPVPTEDVPLPADGSGGEASEPVDGTTPEPIWVLDRDAIFALHEPDEIVATVDGREIPWDMYCYWMSAAASDVENYMLMMSYYGGSIDWTDPWNEGSEESFLDYVVRSAEESVKQVSVIENMAEELGVVLSEESEEQIAQTLEDSRIEAVGEDGSEEEYRAYMLENGHVTPEFIERMTRLNYLYQESYQIVRGRAAEAFSEEEALAWLEENGYVAANHILVETAEEAEAILAELREIGDTEELLARFAALKTEKDLDPGGVTFPEGYVFLQGEMVPAFEEAAFALESYELSDPVQTDYGYHVILRLPLKADAVIDYGADGSPVTAASLASESAFTEQMDERQANAALSYTPGFELGNLEAFLKRMDA